MKQKVRGVIIHEWKLFLCKLAKWSQFYCLPGGTLEEGETRHEGLTREFIEELGVAPVIGNLVYTRELTNSQGITVTDFWYEIRNPADFLSVDISTCSHGFEHSEVGFYTPEMLADAVVKPDHIWELLEIWRERPGEFVQ